MASYLGFSLARPESKNELAPKKNESLYTVLDNAPFGIYIVNKNGNPDYVNKAMLYISATRREHFMKINFFNHINYQKHKIASKIKKVFKNESFSLKNVTYKSAIGKKNTIRNFIGIPIKEGKEKKALIFVEDISEIKFKEKRAEEFALEWSKTFDAMSDGISIHAPNFTVLNVNKALCDILKINKENIVGQKCFKFFHKTDEPIRECPMKEALETGKRSYAEIYEKTLNAWISISISPVLKNGKIEKVIHSVRNITERKNAENEILKSKEKVSTILHSIKLGIVMVDAEKHEIIDVNETAAKLIALPIDKIVGHVCHKFICPAQVGACPITDLGQKVDDSERILINSKGENVPIYKTVTKTVLDGRKVLVESFIDITEQKKASQLIEIKNKELEKFNKFVVDRELKMIELKKKIKKFEKINES